MGGYQPLTYEPKLYSRILIQEDDVKQGKYRSEDRSFYLESILEDLAPGDVRRLVKAEEEFHQCKGFRRIFPTTKSHRYFQFQSPSYFDKLLDAYEHHFAADRLKGIRKLRKMTSEGYHL